MFLVSTIPSLGWDRSCCAPRRSGIPCSLRPDCQRRVVVTLELGATNEVIVMMRMIIAVVLIGNNVAIL